MLDLNSNSRSQAIYSDLSHLRLYSAVFVRLTGIPDLGIYFYKVCRTMYYLRSRIAR